MASIAPAANGHDDPFDDVIPETEFEKKVIPILRDLLHERREERKLHLQAMTSILTKLTSLEGKIVEVDRKIDAVLVCTGISQSAAEDARDAARKVERMLASVDVVAETEDERVERRERHTDPDLSANIGAAADLVDGD